MALNPLIKIKLLIDRTWNKIWSTIKDHNFTVAVSNQIEIPKIEFPEVKFPDIPKPIDTTKQLEEIVKTIIKQTQELKVSPDTTATKEQLLNILGEIKIVLNTKKKDLTPDLIAGIQALRDDLKNIGSQIPKTDLKPIQSSIEALTGVFDFKGLEKFTRFTDIRVVINEKQFKALSNKIIATSSGGSGLMKTSSGTVSPVNPVPVSPNSQITAFGELSIAELTPIVQVQFPYNINTDIWEIRDNGGTSSVVANKANISTGAGANQSSTILTRIPVKYNPGQGAVVRFTALYTTGVANSFQYVGIGNSTDGYFFGYTGDIFGILRRQGGLPETQRLAITTGSSDADSINITLDGDVEAVTITDVTGDETLTANEISAHDFSNVGEGWEVHNMGASVFFTSYSDGAKSGTYSLTDATSAVGTFSQSLAGVSTTDNIISQVDWNIDKMDGTGISGVTLDPTKGNVFQIQYQWLGFGAISFYIEHKEDGELHLVHTIQYANINTIPSVDNPTLPLYISAKNTSNTSDIIVQVGSMGGFIEGKDSLLGLPHSLSVEKASISTTETPIMTIHAHDIYQGTINRVRSRFTVGTVSIDGAKPATVRIRKNTALTGAVFSALDSNKSIMHVDTSSTAVNGGDILFSESVAKSGSITIDLEKLGIDIIAPDFLTLTIEASSTTVDTVSGLNWLELF